MPDRPTDDPAAARFFDTRAAYMMFVTTTNEKAVVADRIGAELARIEPQPPGLRVLDAGMGDASVLTQLMRRLHERFPHIPWLIVGKEISIEDVRQALARLPDRFLEHPEMVMVVTNMYFREAPRLTPVEKRAADLSWREVVLAGSTSHDFAEQIRDLLPTLAEDWQVQTSPVTGNPLYVRPAVVVLYRQDREFLLRPLVPSPGGIEAGYDLVVASQPYRARTPLERKVGMVLVPLARALASGGRLVAIHAHGNDPGLEIIREVWPEEDPFRHGRAQILAEAQRQLADDPELVFPDLPDSEALLRYQLHAMPSEAAEHIGTSSVLAAWNAAAYVAQIDEPRLSAAMASGAYLPATRRVMERHGEIWFNDEASLITRSHRPTARTSE